MDKKGKIQRIGKIYRQRRAQWIKMVRTGRIYRQKAQWIKMVKS